MCSKTKEDANQYQTEDIIAKVRYINQLSSEGLSEQNTYGLEEVKVGLPKAIGKQECMFSG